jgi:2,3-bisphosphoglycerate-independent phosphoglycerate mutase
MPLRNSAITLHLHPLPVQGERILILVASGGIEPPSAPFSVLRTGLVYLQQPRLIPPPASEGRWILEPGVSYPRVDVVDRFRCVHPLPNSLRIDKPSALRYTFPHMKYITLVPDGMADLPMAELDGQTPMQAARTPNFDALAENSLVGGVLTVPAGMYPGSDVANMGLLGYDPRRYYTGRGPIEAVAMDVPLDKGDAAYRCSLVTSDGETMIDYSSGHISTEEARPLIELIDQKLGRNALNFYVGVQYRHIMAWRGGAVDVKTIPPHDIIGQSLAGQWPEGDGADKLKQWMYDSLEILDSHPINRQRRSEGKAPGSMIWLWGQGYAPSMPNFLSTFGKRGALVTAVDVVRGLGRATGLDIINVPGATGYIDTNYRGKADYAVAALEDHDFVYIHVESPDESGHEGNLEHKIRAIEDIDMKLLGPLREQMAKRGEYRLLIVPDHATPLSLRTHKEGPVPFLLYQSSKPHTASHFPFDERAVEEANTQVDDGTQLIRMLFA